MKYRINAILEDHITKERHSVVEWHDDYFDTFDAFVDYSLYDSCIECLVFSVEQDKDILSYTP